MAKVIPNDKVDKANDQGVHLPSLSVTMHDSNDIDILEQELHESMQTLANSKNRNALISVLGLLTICIVSGLLFNAIEAPEERKFIEEYDKNVRKPIDEYLENVLVLTTQKIENLNETFVASMIQKIQESTADQKALVDTMRALMEGEKSAAPKTVNTSNWGIPSSIFFSLTIVSTIGYGAFTASTGLGKLFTVILAVFGVSYFGYCLSIVGERVLYALEYTLNRFILRHSLEEILEERQKAKDLRNEINFKLFGFLFLVCWSHILTFAGLTQYFQPDWGFQNSIYFAIISFTTVGLGDFYPKPTADTNMGERLAGYFCFTILLLLGLALVSAVIAAVSDAAEILQRLAKKKIIALEQNLEKSIKANAGRMKLSGMTTHKKKTLKDFDNMSKPDYVMSEEERNAIRLNILAGIRNDCGAGSDEYTLCVKIIDRIESYRAKDFIGISHVLALEKDAKDLCGRSPTTKHEIAVYLLNFIHNVNIESDEEEAKDIVWEQRIKTSIGFGAFTDSL